MPYTYEYPRPSVTVDCVVFRLAPNTGHLQVLLIRRGGEPFKDCWAVPGGFVEMGESLDEAARRELEEETGVITHGQAGVVNAYLEQLYTFGAPGRDPRGRVISVAYYALLFSDVMLTAGSDASQAQWFDVAALPKLAFDHDHVVAKAVERLTVKVRYAPVIFGLLPDKFTLAEMRRVYEAVTGLTPDARHFRRKVEALGVLAKAGLRATGRRPATLYRFDGKKAAKRQEFYL